MSTERFYSPDEWQESACDPAEEMLASLSRINTFNPPVQTCSTGWKFSGLYSGPTSIAFLFYRLSKLYPDLAFKSQSLEDWAISYLELGSSYATGERNGRPRVDPDHCGVTNETLAQLAVRAVIYEDTSLVQQLCSYSPLINSPYDGSDEWLYGRVGYLYLLRLAISPFPSTIHSILHTQLSKTITETINRILSTPQPWQWHSKTYLGAVHGTAGIITQLLLSSPTTTTLLPTLQPHLTSLLNHQHPSTGNFPSSLPSLPSPSSPLIQFCHGAPGIILSLTPLLPHLPNPSPLTTQIHTAITTAQPLITSRGILTKPPCLCHGIPSNALALSSDAAFLKMLSYMRSERLEENVTWMADAGMRDSFAGLFTGEAGRAWTWAVADQVVRRKEKGHGVVRREMGVIGFSDV